MDKFAFLAAIDWDSTLIQSEIIDEMAGEAGKRKEISKITELVKQGKLDFEHALKERCALLAGLKTSDCKKVASRIKATKGAGKLIEFLQSNGFAVVVISGSLNPCAGLVASRPEFAGLDCCLFNELELSKGKLTGKVKILVGNDKGKILKKLQKSAGVPKSRTISIGDSSGDAALFANSSFSIGFRPNSAARKSASASIIDGDISKAIPKIAKWLDSQQNFSETKFSG